MEHYFRRGWDHCEFCGVSREKAFVSTSECPHQAVGANFGQGPAHTLTEPATTRRVLHPTDGWQNIRVPHQGAKPIEKRPEMRMKSINRFSQDHDWSRWFTYKLIREGHLKVVQVFGRKRITEAAERAFDEAVERGLLSTNRGAGSEVRGCPVCDEEAHDGPND